MPPVAIYAISQSLQVNMKLNLTDSHGEPCPREVLDPLLEMQVWQRAVVVLISIEPIVGAPINAAYGRCDSTAQMC